MKDALVSLISGLIGVLVGAVIQIVYANISNKRQVLYSYKRLCIDEWLAFMELTQRLIQNPAVYNSGIFRQVIAQNKAMLDFLRVKKNIKAIDELQETIAREDEDISLSDYAEEALNIGENNEHKSKLLLRASFLVTKVLERLEKL